MRIASFNVENLFRRARALDPGDWDRGRDVLDAHARLNALFGEPVYTAEHRTAMLELLTRLGLHDADSSAYATLRVDRGRLLVRHPHAEVEIVAGGRADWVGWAELTTESVDEASTRHTAMVMRDLDPDVIAVVEVEDRPALRDFSDILLPKVGGHPFGHVMLIDGNDDRGIDVGLMTKADYEIAAIHSHVDDADPAGRVFSRDCPEYTVRTPSGERLVMLVNHLKSKGHGSQARNDARRRRQAERVAEIYDGLRAAGEEHVVVLGDFNDSPGSSPLQPLLDTTDLHDITESPAFTSDGRPGTFGNGTASQKIDYLLLSPELFGRVTGGGIFRKGAWGGTHGDLWPHYEDMHGPHEAASDHAAIYAEIAL